MGSLIDSLHVRVRLNPCLLACRCSNVGMNSHQLGVYVGQEENAEWSGRARADWHFQGISGNHLETLAAVLQKERKGVRECCSEFGEGQRAPSLALSRMSIRSVALFLSLFCGLDRTTMANTENTKGGRGADRPLRGM